MSRISNLSSRIFVGGLNQDVDEADLEKAFKLFGEVTNVMVMRDRENGRSRGFAFISFKNPQSSEEAISKMHGVEIGGKCVSVRHAERAKHLDNQQGSNDRRVGPAPMHSPLPYRGGGNFRPSDRVFVTQDEDQGSSNVHNSYRSRSPLGSPGGRYQDDGPNTRAYARGEHFSQRRDNSGHAGGEGSRYYGADRQFASDDYRGQPRFDYNYRSRTEQELSPAREINAYINSRARSYSPLLQLSQKLITNARERVPGNDDYDRSPIRSDSRSDLRQKQFSYLDRSKTNERGSQHSFTSLGTQDRGDLPKHNTDYRSRSPRSTVSYQRRSFPDSTYGSERRGDGSAKRYSMERNQRRSSPVSGRGDVGIRPRSSPQRSGMRDGKLGRSHERTSPSRRSPIRGRAGRGDFDTRFAQGRNDYGLDAGRQQGENTSSHRDSWDKPGIQRDRRNSPPSGGKGSSFDDRGSYRSKPMQNSRERQTDTNSTLRSRDGSPRGSWNKFQHRESNGNRMPARNSPPRRGSSISDTRGEVRAPHSAIERGREEFRAPRDPHRRPQSGNRRY